MSLRFVKRVIFGHSQIYLYQNCTKTLCNWRLGGYFEREADPPKLLKTLKTKAKDGAFRGPERACKAGALPAELHAHTVQPIHSQQFTASSSTVPASIFGP